MKINSTQKYPFNKSFSQTKAKNIAFEGVKQNLRLGEAVLKEFRKEFNFHIKSSTQIDRKIISCVVSNKDDDKKIKKLIQIQNRMASKIIDMNAVLKGFYLSVNDFVNRAKSMIKFTKHANCHLQAEIIKQNLGKKGIESHNIGMIIIENESKEVRMLGEHVFTVFGLKKNANLTKPSTWGNKAVIIDPWSNIVMTAKDGIEYLQKHFFFNKETTTLHFCNSSLRKKRFMPFFKFSSR